MRRLIFTLLTAALLMPVCANAQIDSRSKDATQAVMRVYDDELAADPTNAGVYLRRAYLLYGQNQYARALNDADNAIKYGGDDLDLLQQSYALRGNIYIQLGKEREALDDIAKAYELDPASYALCYQKANLEYALGDYRAAREDYRRLERINPRSLESLIGQARIAVVEQNYGMANEYADRAVALYPANPEAYLRRASVRRQLGNNTGAVEDMIMSLSIDTSNSRAISAIVDMSNYDYAAVITALTDAVTKAPNNGMFLYIRATIEQAHYHYRAAIADFNSIIDGRYYDYAGIYASLAKCYYAICDYDKARDAINHAIGMTSKNSAYYITLAKIHLAMGAPQVALVSAERALNELPDNAEAIEQLALCHIALKDYDEASIEFGELIINVPNRPLNYIMRGWVLDECMGNVIDGYKFFVRCTELEFDDTDVNSLRGFAYNLMGDNDKAQQWIEAILASDQPNVDGRLDYLAACLYSHMGMTDKAFESMRKALSNGYANLHDWRTDSPANIDVQPLRSDARFEQLLRDYEYLFAE